VFISVGTNIDREENLRRAIAALKARFGELEMSRVYESGAQGFDGEPFYNLVVSVYCSDPAEEIAATLKQIELAHGRQPGAPKFAPRTLDLDLLTYGDSALDLAGLKLPREDILRYAFVLRPLAELAPHVRHPGLGKSYRELWHAFDGPDDLIPVTISFD
jgi:2-amino-4-hydroxy-6-hydroxymethyldihydropteridine diphosphokinase